MLRPKLVVSSSLPRRLRPAPPIEGAAAAATKLPASEATPSEATPTMPQSGIHLGAPAPEEPVFRRLEGPPTRQEAAPATPQRAEPPKLSDLPRLAAAGLLRPEMWEYEREYALCWEVRPDLLVKLLTKAEYHDPDVNPYHPAALGAPGRRSRAGIPNIDYRA